MAQRTLIGLILGLVVGGLVGYQVTVREKRAAMAGWQLEPVVVAAQKIPAGTRLGLDLIAQREMPLQFITGAVAKPTDAARLQGSRTLVALEPGDLIRMTELEHPLGAKLCAAVCAPAASAAPGATPAPKQ